MREHGEFNKDGCSTTLTPEEVVPVVALRRRAPGHNLWQVEAR